MNRTVMIRYGAISEVSRFRNAAADALVRGRHVVVRTHRGVELGMLLENAALDAPTSETDDDGDSQILRIATDEDDRQALRLRAECEAQFPIWVERIRDWNVRLELIDLEWTLDRAKLILYVLNDRGPECTQLALRAAAAGLGVIEVQPVNAEGLVALGGGGGCGSGGCGSGGCGH